MNTITKTFSNGLTLGLELDTSEEVPSYYVYKVNGIHLELGIVTEPSEDYKDLELNLEELDSEVLNDLASISLQYYVLNLDETLGKEVLQFLYEEASKLPEPVILNIPEDLR